MLETIVKIKKFCDFVIKTINNNNKLEEKINKLKLKDEELENEIKRLHKELKNQSKIQKKLKEKNISQETKIKKLKNKVLTPKVYKNTNFNGWDKDCLYYLKCKEKNNKLCNICKENQEYHYE